MGRRPNPIILQFFERGAKLDDSSNRYQHTCKSCGEKFPKGRIDNLTAHLLKKCPAISTSDRQYALDKLSEAPNRHGYPNNFAVAAGAEQELSNRNEPHLEHSMSALETLAEVSRQHLDTSENSVLSSSRHGKRKRKAGSGNVGSAFEEFIASDPKGSIRPLMSSFEESRPNQIESSLLDNLEQLNRNTTVDSTATNANYVSGSTDLSSHDIVTSESRSADHPVNPEDLRAGETENALGQSIQQPQNDDDIYFDEIDPSLQPAYRHASVSSIVDQRQPLQQAGTSETLLAPPLNQSYKIHAPYLNDFSSLPHATRPRPRKRFSDSRREEVRGIRKQGACIRCRMLKKPCSDGTPCSTCAKLVSSRLWKQPCLRTRLGEDFDFYNAGVHNIIFFHETNHIKHSTQPVSSAFRFEASHFPDGKFSPVQFMGVKRIFSEPNLPMLDANSVFTPDTDTDNSDELERYIRESSHAFVEHEPSHNIRESLKLAESLTARKTDPMLEKAVLLWTATQILVDPQAEWRIKICSMSESDTSTEKNFGQAELSSRFQIDPSGQWATSHAHVLSYLRSSVERVCTITARTLVNELERRLLMRSQTSPSKFETFLTSFILLNCLERVCWLFESWDVAATSTMGISVQPEPSRIDHSRNSEKQTTVRGSWHVERSPREFVAKGQSFSDTLTMLLRVRKIPPQTREDENGILRAIGPGEDEVQMAIDSTGQEHRIKQHARGGQSKGKEAELPVRTTFGLDKRVAQQTSSDSSSADATAATWLNRMTVRLDAVQAQQELANHERPWDAQDCRCWELAFCGPMLLPTNE